MPYKSSGRWVLVKRGGKWVRLRQAESVEAAQANAAALNINVAKHERRKKREGKE